MKDDPDHALESLDPRFSLFLRAPGIRKRPVRREIRAGAGIVGRESTVLRHQDEERRAAAGLWENGISHGTPPKQVGCGQAGQRLPPLLVPPNNYLNDITLISFETT